MDPEDTDIDTNPVGDDFTDFINDNLLNEEEPEAPAVETEEPETTTEDPEEPESEEPEEPETSEEEPEAEEPETPEEEPETPEKEEEEPDTPSNKDHWNNLRSSRDRHKAASEEKDALLAEKAREIEELRATAAQIAEYQEKLKVFDEQEKELALAKVESTREYKETIEAPLQAIGQQVESLATENEADVDSMFRMLREADPAKQRTMLKEITNGWDDLDRIDLKKMVDDARGILDKQEAMRANAHAAAKEREQIASQREIETKEAARKEYLATTKDVVKELSQKLPFVALKEGETAEDHAAALVKKLESVDFDNQSIRAKALAAASALEVPRLVKTVEAKNKEIAELKAALAKTSKSKPTIAPTKESTPEKEDQSFWDGIGISNPSDVFSSMALDVRGEG